MNDFISRTYGQMKHWYLIEAKYRNYYMSQLASYTEEFGEAEGLIRFESTLAGRQLAVNISYARNMVLMNATVVIAACAYENSYDAITHRVDQEI